MNVYIRIVLVVSGLPRIFGELGTVWIIDDNYYQNEFNPFIVYGKRGIGKSSYAMQCAAYSYGTYDNPDWETMKEYIVFKPEDFVDRCLNMCIEEQREKVLIWDDAGLWLYAMDYNDPFVIAVTKYLNVARTNWASIIFTTPFPTLIVKKIRSVPDAYTCEITKMKSNLGRKQRLRKAQVYDFKLLPDLIKSRVHKTYADENWDAMLPDHVFKWYEPIRSVISLMGIKVMSVSFSYTV